MEKLSTLATSQVRLGEGRCWCVVDEFGGLACDCATATMEELKLLHLTHGQMMTI